MFRRERVVVEIGIDDRRRKLLGKRHTFGLTPSEKMTPPPETDDREFRFGEKIGRFIKIGIGTWATREILRGLAIS